MKATIRKATPTNANTVAPADNGAPVRAPKSMLQPTLSNIHTARASIPIQTTGPATSDALRTTSMP
ncbi:Uncharacterised protein [Mycobacteroides abscessus subsp. abscessus]|nr:Uncharacterised protein [Mycobacteroides abscessus subsp. abscessus]